MREGEREFGKKTIMEKFATCYILVQKISAAKYVTGSVNFISCYAKKC
jgi:hypothetical protein